jgi:glycosyltransferase involved in cell wall biosynthesis
MTSASPKPTAALSVGISTRDRPEMLQRCMEHLLAAQVLPIEIIVVDQSHDSRTRQAIERLNPPASLRLVYLAHSGNGLGAAQNLAFERAEQPLVAVTDDDCVPEPDWVARIQHIFSQPDAPDVLTGRILPLGPERPGRYAVASRFTTRRVDFDRGAMPWDIGSGNNFSARRSWLLHIGGNDGRLGPGAPGQGGGDMDLFYRLLRAGARMRYDPAVLVYHERTDRAGRLGRRGPYGYGMGAACIFWLRQGDLNSLRVLARWFLMRSERLLGAMLRLDFYRAYEQALVLNGTCRGILYGWRAPKNERLDAACAASDKRKTHGI